MERVCFFVHWTDRQRGRGYRVICLSMYLPWCASRRGTCGGRVLP